MSGEDPTVTLTVLTSQAELAETFMDDYYQESEVTGVLSSYNFYEISNGELDFLDALRAAGIAYLNEWTDGRDFGAGCISCRFTDEGGVVIKEVYDSEVNPHIDNLLELIDQPEQLRAFILAHKELRSILPWDNQEEYGKLYRTHQLINT